MFFAKSLEDKTQVAIKKMPHRTHSEKEGNFQEIGYLKLCTHPNIVRYKNAYLIKDEIHVCILVDLWLRFCRW